MTRTLALAIALAVAGRHAALAEPPEPPEPNAAAEQAFTALRYDDVLRLVDAAWKRGGNDPAGLRRLFALAGQAAGSIGDDEAARQWFARWLCLEPDAALPVGTSPKLTAVFAAARDSLAGSQLAAHARSHDGRIALVIASDPLALAAAVRDRDVREPIVGTRATLASRASTVDVVDRYGNVLVHVAVETELARRDDAGAEPAASPPVLARWTTWAAVAGGFAVVGGGALWVAVDARSSIDSLNATSSSHEFSDAQSLQTRFDRARWVSGIAFGASVGAVVVAGILYVRGHRGSSVSAPRGDTPLAWSFEF